MLRLSEGLGLPVRKERTGRHRERCRKNPEFALRPVRGECHLREGMPGLPGGAPAPQQGRGGLVVENSYGGSKARPKACLGARKLEGKGAGRASGQVDKPRRLGEAC